jgi:hypothetical protein
MRQPYHGGGEGYAGQLVKPSEFIGRQFFYKQGGQNLVTEQAMLWRIEKLLYVFSNNIDLLGNQQSSAKDY